MSVKTFLRNNKSRTEVIVKLFVRNKASFEKMTGSRRIPISRPKQIKQSKANPNLGGWGRGVFLTSYWFSFDNSFKLSNFSLQTLTPNLVYLTHPMSQMSDKTQAEEFRFLHFWSKPL